MAGAAPITPSDVLVNLRCLAPLERVEVLGDALGTWCLNCGLDVADCVCRACPACGK